MALKKAVPIATSYSDIVETINKPLTPAQTAVMISQALRKLGRAIRDSQLPTTLIPGEVILEEERSGQSKWFKATYRIEGSAE